jgi:dipeptidase D
MSDALERLEPRSVWEHFAALAAIPRPSKHEAGAAAYVGAVADRHGFARRTDAVGNVVVEVPGTRGREARAAVALQSHLDMVGEKNRDLVHDFRRDPIRPRLDGEWVKATGTTLGADNGIGVAAALASATDPTVAHGPLELLFTIDEETGLTGAKGLDPSMIRARTLLNLDSEEDGVLYVGCAGGTDTVLRLDPRWEETPRRAVALRLDVLGLSGGHSGVDIHRNRANALKVTARILWAARGAGIRYRVASWSGGSKHNAIPRESEAVLLVDPGDAAAMRAVVDRSRDDLLSEFGGVDAGLEVGWTAAVDRPARVLAEDDGARLVALIAALPHGVLAMSRAIEGLVETSSNVAVVAPEGERVRIVTSSRSSSAPALAGVLAAIAAAGHLAAASVETGDGYPGWQPDLASPILGVVRDVYRRRWGHEPKVTAIHAGLECGLLGERLPGIDMVSIGPQIEAAHSPDERVHVPSVARFWGALGEVLDVVSRG